MCCREPSGRLQFHARVAINVLAMVERELELGAEQLDVTHRDVCRLGFADDAELAAAIRSGELDDHGRVASAVWASVRDKLAVANPKYLRVDRRAEREPAGRRRAGRTRRRCRCRGCGALSR